VPADCPGLSKDAARMTVTPRPPALSSPFESCLVCGLLLASEACKAACRFKSRI
jgi:hypothetical protein